MTTEKITINLGPVDLGKIDVLVEQGHYSTRTDFIKTSIRNQLDKHSAEVQQAVAHGSFVIGVLSYGRANLENVKAKGQRLKLTVVGALHLSRDIPPALALEVIESVRVRGIFHASDELKAVLASRIS